MTPMTIQRSNSISYCCLEVSRLASEKNTDSWTHVDNYELAVTPSLVNFIQRQEPGTEYILSVCTGSWILSATGLLNGKKATTNKALYKVVVESTKDLNITWIPKARYVVDGKYWTSSGVTAGKS